MAEARGDLSGFGPQQIWIQCYREAQDWGGNWTRFRIQMRYEAKGYGSWINQDCRYDCSNPFWNQVGTFRINSPGTSDIVLVDTTFTVGHDGNGYLSGFNNNANISTNHSAIGSGGVNVYEEAAPRIPKRPSPPGQPQFSNALPTSVTVSWSGSGDNGGAGIDAYLLRYWPNAAGSGSYIDHSQQLNTQRQVTGLTPGQEYRFTVYAHNGAADNNGYSNPASANVIRMLAGIRIKVQGVWRMAIPYVKVQGVWKMTMPFVKSGGSWKMTS